MAGTAEASVLIDFSDANGQTTGYININRFGADVSGPLQDFKRVYNLTDFESGHDTTWDMHLTTASMQKWGDSSPVASYKGPKPADLSRFADSALSDGLFMGSDGPVNIEFSNLRPSVAYEFLIYAARGNKGADAVFNVTVGSGRGGQIASVYQNDDKYVTIRATSTDDGRITISWTAKCASNKWGSALNFIAMTEVSKPSVASAKRLAKTAVKTLETTPVKTPVKTPEVSPSKESGGKAPVAKRVAIGLAGIGAIVVLLILKKSGR
jgi:hypothetical protein